MAKYPQDIYGINMVDPDYELLRTGMERSEKSFASDFDYEETAEGIRLLKLVGDVTDVIIPAYFENKKIVDMTNDVFAGNGKIKKIFFPNTLRIVGGAKGCGALQRVVIPFGVRSVYAEAFKDCVSLKTLDLPDSAVDLGYSFCEGCTALESVELSEKLKELPERAFYGCQKMYSINLPYVLETVGAYAFFGCSMLTDIELSVHIRFIGEYAFAFTRPKRMIIMPDCEYVGKKAFYNKRGERFTVLIAEKNKGWAHGWKKGCSVEIHPSIKDTLYD